VSEPYTPYRPYPAIRPVDVQFAQEYHQRMLSFGDVAEAASSPLTPESTNQSQERARQGPLTIRPMRCMVLVEALA
jgi:hypothetical protein